MEEGASDLPSVCISRSSDLKMRIDLPNERAASGSFFAPNSKTTTMAMIAICPGVKKFTVITSQMSTRCYRSAAACRARAAAWWTSRAAAASPSSRDLVGLQGRRRGISDTQCERLRFKHPHGRPESQHQARHPVLGGIGHEGLARSIRPLAHVTHRVVLEHPR